MGQSSLVFVWPRLLLETKVCQPKTLSINNPPLSPEVMYALPCNLIIITGRRTLFFITAMEQKSHSSNRAGKGLTLTSAEESSGGQNWSTSEERKCVCVGRNVSLPWKAPVATGVRF